MKYKTRNELLIEKMNNYELYLKKLSQHNPEQAKVEAKDALIRIGIINNNGKLKPPYNGEKVHEDDFERGPKKIMKI